MANLTKDKILIDARCITRKPCGVRKVAEQYLSNMQLDYYSVVLVNSSTPLDQIGNNCSKIIRVSDKFSRFNILLDFILITTLVIIYRPKHFVSLHSFLPVLSILHHQVSQATSAL